MGSVRTGIQLVIRRFREARIADAYARAYEKAPLRDEEAEMLDAPTELAAEPLWTPE